MRNSSSTVQVYQRAPTERPVRNDSVTCASGTNRFRVAS
jgi:hypothetical protein